VTTLRAEGLTVLLLTVSLCLFLVLGPFRVRDGRETQRVVRAEADAAIAWLRREAFEQGKAELEAELAKTDVEPARIYHVDYGDDARPDPPYARV
jgi:hypothetical protein